MKKSITLRAFPPQMAIEARLKLASEAGYQGVEVNLEPGEAVTLESDRDQLTAFREQIESAGLCVSAVYSRQQWLHPITSQVATTRDRGRAIVERLVWAAPLLGTDTVLTLPGTVDNSLFSAEPETVPYDWAYRSALEVLREVECKLAGRLGVNLALENVWNKFLLSPLELARFVDELASPWVGVYFDVGNAMRTGIPEDWIRILGGRIMRVHFKDFRTAIDNADGFVNLLQGDVNWPAVMSALRSVGYQSWLTAEVLPPLHHHGERLIWETSASMDAIMGPIKERRDQ
jgi:L-ribulose-5-phosphate 3-epimerase